jgi:hypothetical protein
MPRFARWCLSFLCFLDHEIPYFVRSDPVPTITKLDTQGRTIGKYDSIISIGEMRYIVNTLEPPAASARVF